MISAITQARTGLLQGSAANHAPKSVLEGQRLQTTDSKPRFDRLELSGPAILREKISDVPSELSIEKPRAWSIATQTLESRMSHVENSIKKADSLGLSFGDRLTFLREEGMNWTQSIRQSDPEKFVAWLKMNQENIASGRSDLASLPSDFTMEDYHAYVKEPFVAFV